MLGVCISVYVCSSVILSILSILKGSKFLSLVLSLWFFNGIGKIILQGVCVCVFSSFCLHQFSHYFKTLVFSRVFPSTFRLSEREKKLNRDASLVIARGTKIKEGVSRGFWEEVFCDFSFGCNRYCWFTRRKI